MSKITPLTDDKMFYHIMHTNKDYLIMLIHLITNIPIERLKDLEYIDTTLNEGNINNKHQRSDVVVKIEGYTINLEMNANYYKEMAVKNNSYLYTLYTQDNIEGKGYNTTRIFIQINFDKFKTYGKKLLNEYIIKEKNNNMEYPLQRIKIYHIELDYLQNEEYTKSVNNKLIRYLKFLLECEVEKLKEMSIGDKILEGVVKEMIIFGKEIPYGYRDVELEDRLMKNTFRKKGLEQGLKQGLKKGEKIGLELGIQRGMKQGMKKGMKQGIKQGMKQGMKQGIEQKSLETAEYLLSKGLDDGIILGASGISVSELNKLREINKIKQ